MTTAVSPIRDSDLPQVGTFLRDNLLPRLSAERWAHAWRQSINVAWKVDAPNHGFLIRDGERLVGVYPAIYSERTIDGRVERFCNLTAWCVLPSHRSHSLRLLSALLAQDGYHFTDLSPDPTVQRLNGRLGFQFLDTATALVVNLPWPSWPGRTEISSDPARIAQLLTGAELRLYRHHADATRARHLVLVHDDQPCYVVFRKERRKNLPLFASILYVSDPVVFQRAWRPLARHLLVRYGALATLAEPRVVGSRPYPSVLLPRHWPKMLKSPDLDPRHVDYLYSELACAPW